MYAIFLPSMAKIRGRYDKAYFFMIFSFDGYLVSGLMAWVA